MSVWCSRRGWAGQNFYNFPRSNHLFLLSPIHSGGDLGCPEAGRVHYQYYIAPHTVINGFGQSASDDFQWRNQEWEINNPSCWTGDRSVTAWHWELPRREGRAHYYYSNISRLSNHTTGILTSAVSQCSNI